MRLLKTYATKAKIKTIKRSSIVTTFKSILKSITTVKNNIGKFIWSVIEFLRLDKILTPTVLKIVKLTGKGFRYLSSLFILFNFILITWLCYYNSPILTYKLLFGWILDFISVAKITYSDIVAKFFDYISSIGENGIKSVPLEKDNKQLIDYTNNEFINGYKEVFGKIKELPLNNDYIQEPKSRWYDFLRDDNLSLEDKNRNTIASVIKDNYQYFIYPLGFLVLVGLGWYYWDPLYNGGKHISSSIFDGTKYILTSLGNGINTIGSSTGRGINNTLHGIGDSIHSGMVYIGNSITSGINCALGWFAGNGSDGVNTEVFDTNATNSPQSSIVITEEQLQDRIVNLWGG